MAPGKNPAIKASLTDIPAETLYIINGKLGGNNKPNEPATVINPNENISEYPSFLSIGYKSPPRASIVTRDQPVIAVKKPLKITTTIGVPPGIHAKAD